MTNIQVGNYISFYIIINNNIFNRHICQFLSLFLIRLTLYWNWNWKWNCNENIKIIIIIVFITG